MTAAPALYQRHADLARLAVGDLFLAGGDREDLLIGRTWMFEEARDA